MRTEKKVRMLERFRKASLNDRSAGWVEWVTNEGIWELSREERRRSDLRRKRRRMVQDGYKKPSFVG